MQAFQRLVRAAIVAGATVGFLATVTFSTAHAYPATWEFKGKITAVPAGVPPDLTVGTPFRLVMSFDTAESIDLVRQWTNPATGQVLGRQYVYFSAQSLKFTIFAGTSCNPCTPSDDVGFDPSRSAMNVRDNYPVVVAPGATATDGMSFSIETTNGQTLGVILRDAADAFSPPIVDVNPAAPQPLPVLPDPRFTQMATRIFQACPTSGGDCLVAQFDEVSVPTYGTYYFLSGRHCLYPDLNTTGFNYGDDCVVSGAGGGGQPLALRHGGSAGLGDFSETASLSFPTPSTADAPDAVDFLGTVYGGATFGGPAGLPVIRGSSFPSRVGRTNGNVLAYQEYVYTDTEPTYLYLVVDAGYEMGSEWFEAYRQYPITPNWPTPRDIEVGLRPGGAMGLATISVIDGNLVPPAAMAAIRNFNSLTCGNEAAIDPATGQYMHQLPDGSPWPPGSIMGMAQQASPALVSPPSELSAQFDVLACDGNQVSPDTLISLPPGQRFYLTATLQTPARGILSQTGVEAAISNGFFDGSETIRVIPDPTAPPAEVQKMLGGLAPTCSDCAFEPEVQIDVKPTSTDNVISVGSKGNIPVALLGSDHFHVDDVVAASLRLGALPVNQGGKGSTGCSIVDVNIDGRPDLMCHFTNAPGNWSPGQTLVTLTGKLANGESIFASDSVRLVQ